MNSPTRTEEARVANLSTVEGVHVAKFGGRMVTDSNGKILDFTVHNDEKSYKNALNRQRTLATNGAKKIALEAQELLKSAKGKTKIQSLAPLQRAQKLVAKVNVFANRFKTKAALKAAKDTLQVAEEIKRQVSNR
jgi:hypothetical protein